MQFEEVLDKVKGSYKLLIVSYVLIFSIHKFFPARLVEGYCCDSDGKPLVYRLNGIWVNMICIAFFYLNIVDRTLFYSNFIGCSITACLFGIVIAAWFYARGYTNQKEEEYCARNRCQTVDQKPLVIGSRRSPCKIKDDTKFNLSNSNTAPSRSAMFFLGCEWNPRIFNVDIKMFLYIVGAVYLQINILSAIEYQCISLNIEKPTIALQIYSSLFTFFLFEYLYFEEIHLYTYDLFAEKVGFKLIWGCLFFYPFFYCVGIHCIVSTRNDIQPMTAFVICMVYMLGWIITRGANLQKYYYKRNPKNKYVFFNCMEQRHLPKHPKILGTW
jgi:Delta14-sterol reductase